ncbi:MAG: CPBP family intramembrane metalloprotease [Nitrospinae bacterium]|nr:CPBP family intramembrane metalloprotease [Nitrospinota bacterium]
MKLIAPILAPYFLVLFPTVCLVFSTNRFIYEYWNIIYFTFVLVLTLALKRVSLQQLGFNNNGKSLGIGLLLGILPIISVPILDSLLIKSGLSQSEFFAGADLRVPIEMGFSKSVYANLFTTTLIPFIDQLFVTGLVVNHLLKKQHVGQAMLGGGLLYSLLHFKPSLGNLTLGIISIGLLRATGSIVIPMLVHAGFAIAEILIVFQYPRLISLLVFVV